MTDPDEHAAQPPTPPAKPTCGLVMPISAIDGCSEEHWSDVNAILTDALTRAGFDTSLVSEAEAVSVIHANIVARLYNDPLVVCDISARNPNVMFELGLRIAFDRPTIIVKDEKTPFSFDTQIIEHIEYPRDLRFPKIQSFKHVLTRKAKATYEKHTDPTYSPFLKHFGGLTAAKLPHSELSLPDQVLSELHAIRRAVTFHSPPKTSVIPPFSPPELATIEAIAKRHGIDGTHYATLLTHVLRELSSWIAGDEQGDVRLNAISWITEHACSNLTRAAHP